MPVLVPETKDQILKTWAKEGLDPKKGWELRRQAQTDGFWLAKEVLGYKDFAECHEEVFDFFVQKDPDAADFRTFAESYEGLHDDLLMLCRGGFKSTADVVDSIQWIICFPDIRINIMTGTNPLAEEFAGLIMGHFRLNKDGSRQLGPDGKPRLLQLLFPEHCTSKMPLESPWTTPARRSDVAGPTIRATSIDSNTTGTHCDILKCDDCTTAENTGTADRIRKINKSITMARKLVEPYGFKLRIGTPYDLADNLAATVTDEEKRAATGKPPLVKVLLRPAYTVLHGYEDVPVDELTDKMVKLWFPERITLKFLQAEYADAQKSDVRTFFGQYLLDLKKANYTKFSRSRLVENTIPFEQIPAITEGHIFESWDLSYGQTFQADFRVGLCGLFARNRIYLLDMVRGKWNEDLLPRIMAEFAFKWKPERVAVEDSVGARWLKKEIYREMRRLRFESPFEFVSLGQGTKESGKIGRAKPVINMVGNGKLVISAELPDLEAFYDELELFPPPRGKKDDIVDTLSLLVNHFYVDSGFDGEMVADEGSDETDDPYYRYIYGLDRDEDEPEQPQIIEDDLRELFQ